MGCCVSSRAFDSTITPEEKLIYQAELSLKLSEIQARDIVTCVDRENATIEPWAKFPGVQRFTGSVFYQHICDDDGWVSREFQKTLGIFMGKGGHNEKAELLYETFNENWFLGPKEIRKMLYSLVIVSTELLWLITDETELIEKYYLKLIIGKEKFVNMYYSKFYDTCKTTLYAQDFHSKIMQNPGLLSTSFIRNILIGLASESEILPFELRVSVSEEELTLLNKLPAQCSAPRFQCINGHCYEWTNRFIFSKPYAECDQCAGLYSRAGWYCEPCDIHICDHCGEEQGVCSKKLKCVEGHTLLYKCDTPEFYSKVNGAAFFYCDICTRGKSEPSWHCRKCKFDICIECAKGEGYSAPSSALQCNNKHILSVTTGLSDISCGYCDLSIQTCGLHCEVCSYSLCSVCEEFLRSPAADHLAFQCPSWHLFHWYGPLRSIYTCSFCLEVITEPCFTCNLCEIYMCGDCGTSLSAFFNVPIILTCHEEHTLAWNPILPAGAYTCTKCWKELERIGSFHCAECEYNLCLKCVEY